MTRPESAGPGEVAVSFDVLRERFLAQMRHLEDGTVELYTSYVIHHLVPFFGDKDLGQILRTRPLRPGDKQGWRPSTTTG